MEALCQTGQLAHLKEQMAQLEAIKSDHTKLKKLCLLFLEGGGSHGGMFGMGTPWVGSSLCSEPGPKGETTLLTACPLGPCPSR